jgi:hypothetical protein
VAENPAWRHAGSDSTITKSTTAKRRTKSRNRDTDPRTVSVSRLVADEFLRGWQYDNLLLACTAAPSRTASDAPESWCTYLRVCQVVPRYANSFIPSEVLRHLRPSRCCGGYCSQEQDRQRRREAYGKAANSLAVFWQHRSPIPVLPVWLNPSHTAGGQG